MKGSSDIEVVAINDLGDIIGVLLNYDSIHGRLNPAAQIDIDGPGGSRALSYSLDG